MIHLLATSNKHSSDNQPPFNPLELAPCINPRATPGCHAPASVVAEGLAVLNLDLSLGGAIWEVCGGLVYLALQQPESASCKWE